MGDISKNFSRHEFACKCGCGFDTVDVELAPLCEEAREEDGGNSLTPNSGCRCMNYNMDIGGSRNSLHMEGKAADLPVKNPRKVYDYFCKKYPDKYGFGLYKTFIHIDCRDGYWRSD